MMIVDGGYLAWTYGPEVTMHQAWQTGGRRTFARSAGAVICLDAPTNWRTSVFPQYKQDRKVRTANSPDRQAKHDRVVQFLENHIKPDPSLNTILLENCEADDVVAMAILTKPGSIVFGVDKDLLQVPKPFFLTNRKNQISTVKTYALKGPVTLRETIQKPRDILLDLCLRGDSSDSIPGVLPPRRLDIAVEIMSHPRPFTRARELFCSDFVRNLQIAVLPGPHCLQHMPSKHDLVDLVESGEYWQQPLKTEYSDPLLEALKQIPLGLRLK